ncbi:hypothetical protein Tco_0829492 [Tanacetum coccineum]
MVNVILPDHVDDVPIVEPNQHDDVPVVPEPVLVGEDEDPEEEEFEEEEEPQEEEDDMEVDIEEDKNELKLTYPCEEVAQRLCDPRGIHRSGMLYLLIFNVKLLLHMLSKIFRASVLPLEVPPDETEASPMDDRRSKKKEMEERLSPRKTDKEGCGRHKRVRFGIESGRARTLDNEPTSSSSPVTKGDSTHANTSSNHWKRTREQTHPSLSASEEVTFLEGANINNVGNTQHIQNGITNSVFPITVDSSHVGTSVSTQRKRTRENVQAISLPAEDASSKRRRGPTTSVGNRRPRRSVCNSGEGCSSFNNGDDDADNDDTTEPIEGKNIDHLRIPMSDIESTTNKFSTNCIGSRVGYENDFLITPQASITKDASFKKANEKHRELLSESGSQTASNDIETELLELRLGLLVEMEKRKKAEVP